MSAVPRRWQRRIAELGLEPHPEGGWYRRLYRADASVLPQPAHLRGTRYALSAILYLLPRGEFSRWHRLASDEVWTFVEGSALALRCFDPHTGICTTRRLDRQSVPLAGVQAGLWQAAHSLGAYTLVSCAVGPAFEFSDFCLMQDCPDVQAALTARCPEWLDAL